MVCIYCSSSTNVSNSRPSKKLRQVWRRRLCTVCGANFTTLETYDLSNSILVIKRNKELQPFSRDKLFVSVLLATNHLKNNVADAGALTNTILRHILNQTPRDPDITTSQIAKIVLSVLKKYDAASSIKYASYQQKMSSYQDITKSLRNN